MKNNVTFQVDLLILYAFIFMYVGITSFLIVLNVLIDAREEQG